MCQRPYFFFHKGYQGNKWCTGWSLMDSSDQVRKGPKLMNIHNYILIYFPFFQVNESTIPRGETMHFRHQPVNLDVYIRTFFTIKWSIKHLATVLLFQMIMFWLNSCFVCVMVIVGAAGLPATVWRRYFLSIYGSREFFWRQKSRIQEPKLDSWFHWDHCVHFEMFQMCVTSIRKKFQAHKWVHSPDRHTYAYNTNMCACICVCNG